MTTSLAIDDIVNLRAGKAPLNLELVRDMTVGASLWLDPFVQRYLDEFIPAGGSKVKILTGGAGSGKSHTLRYLEAAGRARDYVVVHVTARDETWKLNDLPALYRLIADRLDLDDLQQGLARQVAGMLGYKASVYDGTGRLTDYVMTEGLDLSDATREVRLTMIRYLNNADLSSSAFSFAMTLLRDRLIADDPEQLALAARWFTGQRLSMAEKRESGLFDTLRKATARRWLDSLLKLIVLAGYRGLLLLIDDLDVMYERSALSGRFFYTPANIKDSCELFRQLIDDSESLPGLFLIMAGRRSLLDDERRGFRSYEALWMRLQTGLVPSPRFNGLADVIDLDKHWMAHDPEVIASLPAHLDSVFSRYSLPRQPREAGGFSEGTLSLSEIVREQTYVDRKEGP